MAEQTTPPTSEAPMTIAEASARLHAGELTAEALVERCLRQIERLEPSLKACVTVMAAVAREAARAADVALASGHDRRALLGIPLGIKDLIATRGVRTTAGSRVLDDWIPDEDATIFAKLTDAGAIALCKTNTHEFAFGTCTPPTENPWALGHVPGGSSGGSAAAVASGEVLGALGTDTGGSIRIPAGWCGVTGLKPTYGLVSRAGIIPLSWSLDHAGPIARSVEDCAILLDVIAGYDPTDPDSADVPLLDYTAALAAQRSPEQAVRGTRIGVPQGYFFEQLDAEVETAVRAAIAQLAALGATVVEVAMPEKMDDLFMVYRGVQRPEAYTYHADQGWLDARADRYSPEVHANIAAGGEYSAAEYIRFQQRRRAFTDAMRTVLRSVDALAMPTMAIPAPRIEDYARPLLVNGEELRGGALRLTFPFDLTGQPALSLPCGFTAAGLPIGLQFAAAHFGEPTLLRLGHAYQRVSDWHLRVPPIAR
ncbi:MAG TPA: amidase [Ktedonobacterales bacterium]|nr:amidase [Ktedonobacterales bacterium]